MPTKLVNYQLLIVICLSVFHTQVQAAEMTVQKNSVSGLLTWTSNDDGFSIELIQLLPDFVRAVYDKHGLPADEVERIAGYCDFGTIIQNTSQQQLSYRVSDWRYIDKNGKAYPVKTKAQWLEEWHKAGITFAWTLLPGSGDFGIGDWQQGFTTIKIDRNEKFDLVYTWTLDGKKHQGKIENMSCAPASLSASLTTQ
ncbi:MAG TPA: hypothetical protein VMV70_08685 [Gallionella sp.]|nr:hypothetical protein [Gallionella sp.]